MKVHREKIQTKWNEYERFEGEGGAGVLHWQRGGADEPSSAVEVFKREESKEKVTEIVGVRSPD